MILRALFFDNSEEFGQKGIFGQPPSKEPIELYLNLQLIDGLMYS